jgi:hypothetical protein
MKVGCPACRGVKEILKMGLIYSPCDHCEGTGKVLKPIDLDEPKVLVSGTMTIHEDFPASECVEPVEIEKHPHKPVEKEVLHGKKKK